MKYVIINPKAITSFIGCQNCVNILYCDLMFQCFNSGVNISDKLPLIVINPSQYMVNL